MGITLHQERCNSKSHVLLLRPYFNMSKRIRIFTLEDLAAHNNSLSCWISRAGKVYDVTPFLNDHPGGDDLILQYAGKDIEDVMRDKNEHEHSDAAYDMLEEYLIGRIGIGEATVSEGWFCLRVFVSCHVDL